MLDWIYILVLDLQSPTCSALAETHSCHVSHYTLESMSIIISKITITHTCTASSEAICSDNVWGMISYILITISNFKIDTSRNIEDNMIYCMYYFSFSVLPSGILKGRPNSTYCCC